jgi:periplasmic divalent cation tolerance protein
MTIVERSPDALLVFTNVANHDAAVALARTLVERRLAACVNVLGAATSIYRWKGAVESAQEVPVLIKTRTVLYDEVEAAIRELHAYELPEIIAVPVARGLPDYLEWVTAETTVRNA